MIPFILNFRKHRVVYYVRANLWLHESKMSRKETIRESVENFEHSGHVYYLDWGKWRN